MQRHRKRFLGLAVTLLLGVMGSQCRASTVTISVDVGGTVIYDTTGAVDITVLDTALQAIGSAYQFATNGLTSTLSSLPGSVGLSTTGSIFISSVGSTTPTLSVDVVATGILSQTGSNGILSTSASGTYIGVAAGSTSFIGDYQTTILSPAIIGTASGGTTSFGASNSPEPVGTVPSSYSLSNHFIIGLSDSIGGTEGFSGGAVLSAGSVPEPSSVVMLSLGILPLLAIGFGLTHRRRGGVAA
jgi:hypothetical protein